MNTRGHAGEYANFGFAAVTAATAIALTAGFGFAAILSAHVGFGLSVGTWWLPVLQAHGHAQLIGWLGLFIVGVSLYFVPRLAAVPLPRPAVVPWAVGMLFAGVVTRTIGQTTAGLGADGGAGPFVIGLSGFVTLVAIVIYVGTAIFVVLHASDQRSALAAVRPLLVAALAGWLSYGVINGAISWEAARDGAAVVDLTWNRISIDLFVGLTLVPVALAFSVRTFPLYLRLPPIHWSVPKASFVYVGAAMVVLVHRIVPSLEHEGLTGIGHVTKGAVLLYFIWKLDVLFRLRPPWTVGRLAQASGGPEATRAGLPDRGEYGRFELALYLAYVWLLIGVVLEILTGFQTCAGHTLWVDADALRHTYVAGFLTTLLFGMAPRMIPGFVHARAVGVPGLVGPATLVWTVAVLFRIGPLLQGGYLDHLVSPSVQSALFGLSGPIGAAAVFLLAVTLFRTRPT